MPTTSIYDRIYDSALHHPGLCFVAAVPVLWALLRARPDGAAASDRAWLWRFALVFQLLIVLDAYFTGAWAPLPPAHPLIVALAVLFVVVGDLRFFLILERLTDPLRRTGRALLRATAWASALAIASFAVSRALPALLPTKRELFLLFESLFVVLLVVLRAAWLPRRVDRAAQPELYLYLHRLLLLELAQYALWAGCDVFVVLGLRQALLVRIVPNVLYYVVFVPAAFFLAPRALRVSKER